MKLQNMSDIEIRIFQRVRLSIEASSTCLILRKSFQNPRDWRLSYLHCARPWDKIFFENLTTLQIVNYKVWTRLILYQIFYNVLHFELKFYFEKTRFRKNLSIEKTPQKTIKFEFCLILQIERFWRRVPRKMCIRIKNFKTRQVVE